MSKSIIIRLFTFVFFVALVVGCSDVSDKDGPIDKDAAQIRVAPSRIMFSQVKVGEVATKELVILNLSEVSLTILEMDLEARDGGSISDLKLVGVVELPITVPGGGEYVVQVQYAPTSEVANTGRVRILADDPRYSADKPLFVDVDASAVGEVSEQGEAKIQVSPSSISFVPVRLGEVGTEDLLIKNLSGNALKISELELEARDGGSISDLKLLSADEPTITVPGGGEYVVQVQYAPTSEGANKGRIRIVSNDPRYSADKPLFVNVDASISGQPTDDLCPIADAVAKVKDGSLTPGKDLVAVPLQAIILDGRASSSPNGGIVAYEWEVLEKPSGTNVTLGDVESDTGMDRRELFLLTAGTYKIGLNVVDDQVNRSCKQSVVTIQAIPNQKVHIELTWTNPADPDESDKIGSDLDLHFVKMGPGTWFDAPYDIYYNNPNYDKAPIWGVEEPMIGIDAIYGGGPENITLDNPADCQWYGIGAYYFRAQFGTAYATIRVYINTELAYEREHMAMTSGGQFWDVARIHWENGKATVYAYDELYPHSLAGTKPVVTDEMKNSGLCTGQGLY